MHPADWRDGRRLKRIQSDLLLADQHKMQVLMPNAPIPACAKSLCAAAITCVIPYPQDDGLKEYCFIYFPVGFADVAAGAPAPSIMQQHITNHYFVRLSGNVCSLH